MMMMIVMMMMIIPRPTTTKTTIRQVSKKLMPEIPKQKAKIAQLKKELAEERKRAETLSYKLETPGHNDRWHELEGADPDAEQLQVHSTTHAPCVCVCVPPSTTETACMARFALEPNQPVERSEADK